MQIKGVCLDLDGTTLNSSQQMSGRTVATLRRAHSAGIETVIATGRPAAAVQPFIEQVGLSLLAICFNGAASVRLAPGQPPQVLAREQPPDVLAWLAEHDVGCVSSCCAAQSFAAPVNEAHEELLQQYERLEGMTQTRVARIERDGALKFVAICGEARVEELAATAAKALPQARVIPAEMHVEFLSPSVNKGAALRSLFGADELRQHFVAFGDNVNDVEMLQSVGCGVAMRNAKPALKAAATRVSQWSNDDDGVALELNKIILQ